MGRQTEKMNIALLTAAVLLCLTLFTAHLTSGLYARYSTSDQSSDSARVAAFVFDVQAGELMIELPEINIPGQSKTVTIQVSNHLGASKSEVAETYTLTIRELGNLPLTYTLTPTGQDAGASECSHNASSTVGEMTGSGSFAASVEETKTYTLDVAWPTGETDPKYAGGTANLKLTITGEQTD